MNGACNGTILFAPPPLRPGQVPKSQLSFTFNYKVNFKDFLNQILFVYPQMKETVFSFVGLCYAQGVGLVVGGGQEFNFLNMVNVAYQFKGDGQ